MKKGRAGGPAFDSEETNLFLVVFLVLFFVGRFLVSLLIGLLFDLFFFGVRCESDGAQRNSRKQRGDQSGQELGHGFLFRVDVDAADDR